MNAAKPVGLRLIIAYKLTKSLLQVGAAALLFYGITHGLAAELTGFADGLRDHSVHVWSHAAAAALLGLTGQRHGLSLVAAALAVDAVLSSIEGWVLARGYRWGPYLVVATTASLLPFEIVALFRHPRIGRALLLLVNLAIVGYLLRRARR
jgi:hypothetical protein